MNDKSVAPFTGAWIETNAAIDVKSTVGQSHPSRVRGLKQKGVLPWQREKHVAPFTGAWIEIFRFLEKPKGKSICRTLHGCVD